MMHCSYSTGVSFCVMQPFGSFVFGSICLASFALKSSYRYVTVRAKAWQNVRLSASTTGVSLGGDEQLGRLSGSIHRIQRFARSVSVGFWLAVKFLAGFLGSTLSVRIHRRDTLSMRKLSMSQHASGPPTKSPLGG